MNKFFIALLVTSWSVCASDTTLNRLYTEYDKRMDVRRAEQLQAALQTASASQLNQYPVETLVRASLQTSPVKPVIGFGKQTSPEVVTRPTLDDLVRASVILPQTFARPASVTSTDTAATPTTPVIVARGTTPVGALFPIDLEEQVQ